MANKVMANSTTQPSTQNENLLVDIRHIVEQARGQVKQTVNTAMLQAYWQIGRLIVEDEQQGEARAAYGKAILKGLSQQLTTDYDKGFDITNLRNMRRFYLAFEKRDAVRLELSWTHYRVLMRVEHSNARDWYRDEAVLQNWSARALERQIGTLYYERLLSSKEKQPVEQEAQQKTQPLAQAPKDSLQKKSCASSCKKSVNKYKRSCLASKRKAKPKMMNKPMQWGLDSQMNQAEALDKAIRQNLEAFGYGE